MKQGLSLRVSQHLALTPQLQQSIRLLQLSTLELSQEVEQMLDENPFLELGDDIARIKDGDELEIDVAAGKIANLTSGETIGFNPVPKFMMDMLSGGGLVEYVKRKVAQ